MSLHAALRHELSPTFRLDVDLDVPPGITILFGPSGSGKSTILRCLAGLSRPTSGRITLDEAVLFDAERGIDLQPQQRHVGLVFQQLALFPHLTVAGNIGYGLDHITASERRGRVAAIAQSFHISGILDRRPTEISGGERQRTALARSLVTEPRALLLDEPLSALDYQIQSRIIDDLRRWNEARRIPVLYVTHSHREVYALGEQAIVLDQGQVVATGTPHDVLEHPGRGAIAQLAGFENLLSGRIVSRHPSAGTMTVQLDDSHVALEVPLTTIASEDRVIVAIRAGDILVASGPPHGVSARNILEGRVQALLREGPTVVARVSVGATFLVHLTPASVNDLGVTEGSHVWLIIKTYSCRIAS